MELILPAPRDVDGAADGLKGGIARDLGQRRGAHLAAVDGDADAAEDRDGRSGKLPLLVLHGGPGFPHDYLEDLAGLAQANQGRAVVFNDQIGCGRSDHSDDSALWTTATFVEEVAAVRDALGLERVHLLGHSWGGWLALEYALRGPGGIASLILASAVASLPAFAAETRRLKESLPAEVQEVIDRHEADGTIDANAYREATMADYTRWLCRLDLPWPDHMMRSFGTMNEDTYRTMQGPEWNITGNLQDWDVTARLGELDLPVLVTSGRYDEVTPVLVQPLVEGIRGAESVVFKEALTSRWPRSRSVTEKCSTHSSQEWKPARAGRLRRWRSSGPTGLRSPTSASARGGHWSSFTAPPSIGACGGRSLPAWPQSSQTGPPGRPTPRQAAQRRCTAAYAVRS